MHSALVPTAPAPVSSHRDPDDDFFCLRYRIWYPSLDCAYRTKYRTYGGCANCEQGRFNLKRHRKAVGHPRLPVSAS